MTYAPWGACSESNACICRQVETHTSEGFMMTTSGACDRPVSDLGLCQRAVVALGFTLPLLSEEEGPEKACRVYTPTEGASHPSFSDWGDCSPSHPCICEAD
eukprot:TRINITY_DN71459_c0_g1_i1.p1 TRINITY_DN71459_c0_g1~~TRINITY_DN71459_c0_g1_i1.p1  ORF type:complete len:119 (-),score=9.26 TRINITY_DN71459_c0_g1_i1:7-312(-)